MKENRTVHEWCGLDRASFSPEHLKWIEDAARATLADWDRTEDIEQLKVALGLKLPKKRRRALTMREETTIAAAIVDAALAGDADPKRAAAAKLQAEERRVQRAWKAWGPSYLERLYLMESQVSPDKRANIRQAITRLETADRKS